MIKLLLSALFVVACVTSVAPSIAAQSTSQPKERSPRAATSSVVVDELFVLDINERRITESNFEAATAVGIGPEESKNLRVQIGVALSAQSIDVLLRRVSGTVRFRGSLQRLVDLLDSHSPR